ncbi:MAG: sugar phosphate nucleotidyltransferase [archaeon]
MLAVILAAGLGTRLGNLTDDLPKPMLRINGKPFLEYLILQLKRHNIKKIIICVGYKKDNIIQYFKDGEKFGVEISYSESKILGTAGEIKNAAGLIDEDDFLVMNGDSILDGDLTNAVMSHKNIGTICLTKVDNPERYGSVELTGSIITKFFEKNKQGTGIINGGVYILNQKILQMIPEGFCSLEKDIFPRLAEKRQLDGIVLDCYFIDIGTIEDYERAKREMK